MIDDLGAIARCGPESVILNAVINAKINMKNLEFSATKCVKLHICKENRKPSPKDESNAKNVRCVFLSAQDTEMVSADSEKYIGDVISSTGSYDANILRRTSIGMGAISKIFPILNEISFGYNYAEIGMIMRESVLLSKMLVLNLGTNSFNTR